MINILLAGLSATCFEFVPRFSEEIKTPTAKLATQFENSTASQLVSIQWPLCDVDSTVQSCGASEAFLNNFANLKQNLVCENEYSLDNNYLMLMPNTTSNDNGTFCLSNNYNWDHDYTSFQVCNISGHPDMPQCIKKAGSHSSTFWIYFAVRTVFQWTMNSAYSVFDATSLKQASEHNSDYSYIMFFQQLAAIFGPFLAGLVIDDGEGDGNVLNYQLSTSLQLFLFRKHQLQVSFLFG